MIGKPGDGLALWRVGYHADPLGFTALEIYEFSHRFDDICIRPRDFRRIDGERVAGV